jgi:hypothetical protein
MKNLPQAMVGRTPWSAPFNDIHEQADEGVGCGPGGPPHRII